MPIRTAFPILLTGNEQTLCAPNDLPSTLLVAKTIPHSNFSLLQVGCKLIEIRGVQFIPLAPILPTPALKPSWKPFHRAWHHSVFRGGWKKIGHIFTWGLHVRKTAVMWAQEIMIHRFFASQDMGTSVKEVSMQKFLVPFSPYSVLKVAPCFCCAKGCLFHSFVFMGIVSCCSAHKPEQFPILTLIWNAAEKFALVLL